MPETSVFISYRRSDSAASTGRIADRLQQRFGDDRIFHDVDSIELGVNFKTAIEEWLDKTDVFLVVIGDDWLEAKDAEGRRRIDDPRDMVRVEVGAALARGESFPVIPVLVGSASAPPGESELPEDLKSLATRNSIVLRSDAHFEGSMRRLSDYIEARSEQRRTGVFAVPPEPEPAAPKRKPVADEPSPAATEPAPAKPRRRRLKIAGGVVVLVALYAMCSSGPDESGGGDSARQTPAATAPSTDDTDTGNGDIVYAPDLTGWPLSKAASWLLEYGLDYEAVYDLKPGQSKADLYVESTDPPGAFAMPDGSTVTLFLTHIDEWEAE